MAPDRISLPVPQTAPVAEARPHRYEVHGR